MDLLIKHDQTIIDNENSVGETAAMFAAVEGHTEALEMLLEKGAKLWVRSQCNSVEKRRTCLDWAVVNKQAETAKAILKKKDWEEVGFFNCSNFQCISNGSLDLELTTTEVTCIKQIYDRSFI